MPSGGWGEMGKRVRRGRWEWEKERGNHAFALFPLSLARGVVGYKQDEEYLLMVAASGRRSVFMP